MELLMVRAFIIADGCMIMKVSFTEINLEVSYDFENHPSYMTILTDQRPDFFEKIKPFIVDPIVSDLLYSPNWTQLAGTVNTKDINTVAYFAACVERVIRVIIARYERFYESQIRTESNEIATIDKCDQGHKFAKLPDHPFKDGKVRCPYCIAEGLDRFISHSQYG
jgi:hypothetical protein